MESLLFALNLIILVVFCRYALAKDDAERQSALQETAKKEATGKHKPEVGNDA